MQAEPAPAAPQPAQPEPAVSPPTPEQQLQEEDFELPEMPDDEDFNHFVPETETELDDITVQDVDVAVIPETEDGLFTDEEDDDDDPQLGAALEAIVQWLSSRKGVDETEVSIAFNNLKLPRPKPLLRRKKQVLPNCLMGTEAMAMFAAKDEEKRKQEEEKQQCIALCKAKWEMKQKEEQKKKEEWICKQIEQQKIAAKKEEELKQKKLKAEVYRLQKKEVSMQWKMAMFSRRLKKQKEKVLPPAAAGNGVAVVNINKCFKCSGAFKFEDTSVGCDRCPRWFHLRCVPEDVQAMEDDLENAKFECDFCGSPETCSSEWD